MGTRFVVALILMVAVIGSFVSAAPMWRFAPLAISVVWAVVEIVIERRRKPAVPPDSAPRDS